MKNYFKDKLIVSIEQAVAAPYCTAKLADAGARVIKVERKEGDFARYYDDFVKGDSTYFVWLNRGKESLVANIKNNKDVKLLKKIISNLFSNLNSLNIYQLNLLLSNYSKIGYSTTDVNVHLNKLYSLPIFYLLMTILGLLIMMNFTFLKSKFLIHSFNEHGGV